jgi:hypothetical protein
VLQAAPGAAGTRPSAPPEVNGGAAGTKSSAPPEANGGVTGGKSSATPEASGGAADATSSTGGNGRAGDAKSSASAASKTDAAYGKIVGVSLGAGRDTASTMSPASSPTPEAAAAEPPPRPTSRRRLTLRESLRKDWDAARRGLESAPAELERAWRSFTRDVKELFDR